MFVLYFTYNCCTTIFMRDNSFKSVLFLSLFMICFIKQSMLVQITLQSILAEVVLKLGLLFMENSFQTFWSINFVL